MQGVTSSISVWGTKIPHAEGHCQKVRKKKGKKVRKEKNCNQSYQRVKMKREVFRMKDRGYQNMLF